MHGQLKSYSCLWRKRLKLHCSGGISAFMMATLMILWAAYKICLILPLPQMFGVPPKPKDFGWIGCSWRCHRAGDAIGKGRFMKHPKHFSCGCLQLASTTNTQAVLNWFSSQAMVYELKVGNRDKKSDDCYNHWLKCRSGGESLVYTTLERSCLYIGGLVLDFDRCRTQVCF